MPEMRNKLIFVFTYQVPLIFLFLEVFYGLLPLHLLLKLYISVNALAVVEMR